jgi:hypothetical protein
MRKIRIQYIIFVNKKVDTTYNGKALKVVVGGGGGGGARAAARAARPAKEDSKK